MFETKIRISMQYFAESDDNKDDSNANNDNQDSQNNDNPNVNKQDDNLGNNQDDSNVEPKFDFVKELGMSEDEIKKLISDKHEEDEKNKTAETKLAEAISKATKAEAKVSAMQLGVKPNCVDDVIAIASTRDPEGKNFKSTISDILKQYPNFSVSEVEDKSKGTGGSVGSKKKNENSANSIGKRLAESKVKKQTSSFFK